MDQIPALKKAIPGITYSTPQKYLKFRICHQDYYPGDL
jgi:hypothetical protein